MKAFKGFDKNMQCRGYQYEIGKTYEEESAVLCETGFHACEAPLDVLRYYGLKDGNRYCVVELNDVTGMRDSDSKVAGRKITVMEEIGMKGLVEAHIAYTIEKAISGTSGGDRCALAGVDNINLAGGDLSNLAGGKHSNLAGGDWSNLSGRDRSNLVGGARSNLVGGARSNLVGGDDSNLVGGVGSNLIGRDWCNLAGGDDSNLVGGDGSNLVGGDGSNLVGGDCSNLIGGCWNNLVGGDSSVLIARNRSKVKAGINSVIVMIDGSYIDNFHVPVRVKVEIVDGERIKPDTWYTLVNGEFVEAEE